MPNPWSGPGRLSQFDPNGNLTDDPELRFTANGAAVANVRLAVTPRGSAKGDT